MSDEIIYERLAIYLKKVKDTVKGTVPSFQIYTDGSFKIRGNQHMLLHKAAGKDGRVEWNVVWYCFDQILAGKAVIEHEIVKQNNKGAPDFRRPRIIQ